MRAIAEDERRRGGGNGPDDRRAPPPCGPSGTGRERVAPAYHSGMALFESRPAGDARLKEAVEECRKRLRADPADGAAALRLADLLASSGGRQEAVEVLNRVGPRLQKAGRVVEAIAVYKKVEELDPRSEVTSSFLSIIELKKLQEAAARPEAQAAPKPGAPEPADSPSAEPGAAAAASDHRRKSERVHALRREVPLLRDVPAFLFELVLEKIRLLTFEPGATLFSEGDAGGTLLFVATGEVEVSVRGDAGSPVTLEVLRAGDVLGVVSFLSGVPHPTSAVALSRVDVLELDRGALNPLVKKHKQIADALSRLFAERVLDDVLARSRVFGLLPHRDREAVARRMKPVTVKAGEVVIREGTVETGAFLVKRGALRVTMRHAGRELALALLTPHELFGDVSTVRREPRSATVTAVVESELLWLSGPDLLGLLAAHPDLGPALEEVQLERFAKNAERLTGGL